MHAHFITHMPTEVIFSTVSNRHWLRINAQFMTEPMASRLPNSVNRKQASSSHTLKRGTIPLFRLRHRPDKPRPASRRPSFVNSGKFRIARYRSIGFLKILEDFQQRLQAETARHPLDGFLPNLFLLPDKVTLHHTNDPDLPYLKGQDFEPKKRKVRTLGWIGLGPMIGHAQSRFNHHQPSFR